MRKIKLGAMALALALATALPLEVPYTAGLIGTPAAEAGVLSSIKGAAKKVGGAAKTVGRGVKRVVKSEGVQLFGQAFKGGVKEFGKMSGRAAKKSASTAWSGIKRLDVIWKGNKFEPPSLGPDLKKPLPKHPIGAGAWGGNAGRLPTRGAQTAAARDKSVMARPVGAARPSTQPMRQPLTRVHRR